VKKHRDDLEELVKERTTKINQTNETLEREIAERMQAEQTLREREKALEANNVKLGEMNAALKVLLKSRETGKTELEEQVLSNVKNLLVPYLGKVKKSGLDERQAVYIEILESNLNDIISPFSRTLSSRYWNFTPTEVEIANHVREGKTTKEIALLLNSSRRTIEFHRDNLRKKLGLRNKRANLKIHLLTNF